MTHAETRRTSVTAMSNRTFDILRGLAQIWLPALGAAYWGLAEIWDLPYATEVLGTVAVVDTLLGTVLGYQRKKYLNSPLAYDGTLEITPRPNQAKDLYSLDFSTPLVDVPVKEQVVLKINTNLPDASQ